MPECVGWPDDPYCPITPAVAVQLAAPDSKPGFAIFWAAVHEPPVELTVRANDVECVADEPVPVIVTVYVPAAVELEVEIVNVDEPPLVTEDGENDAVAPLGRPVALSETVCAEPAVVAVETVADVPEPAVTVADDGLSEIEKSFVGAVPGPKAATPFGVPSPVGPSYPTSAVQRYAGEHVAVWPVVTSQSALVLAYGYEFGYVPGVGAVASA